MKKLLLLAFVFTAVFTSCKKENTCPAPPPDPNRIIGTWSGQYSGSDPTPPNTNCCIELKSNGEMIFHDGRLTPDASTLSQFRGTWTLNGNIFKCIYRPQSTTVIRSVLATLNSTSTNLVGTRGANTFEFTGFGQINVTKL